MVMVEALAGGTPVIATPEGAAAEIVIDGENGMLVADEQQMASAVNSLPAIDPRRCRASVAERYHIANVTTRYEHVYRRAIATDHRHKAQRVSRRTPHQASLPFPPPR